MCYVAMLGRDHERQGNIFASVEEDSEEQDQACEAMVACRYLASFQTPESEEGWAFLAYVWTWCRGGTGRDHFLMESRLAEMFSKRYEGWPTAA
jgi:hypothetical protein